MGRLRYQHSILLASSAITGESEMQNASSNCFPWRARSESILAQMAMLEMGGWSPEKRMQQCQLIVKVKLVQVQKRGHICEIFNQQPVHECKTN